MTEDTTESKISAREHYAARRRDKAVQRSETVRKKGALVMLVAILAVVVTMLGAEFALSVGRVHPGVSVAGVDIGGMKPAKARTALSAALTSRANKPVTVTFEDKSWQVTSEQVGLGFDDEAQISAAMAVGRKDDVVVSLGERLRCWSGGIELDAAALSQSAKMDTALGDIARETDVPPVNASVQITGSQASVIDGKDGRALDRPALSVSILNAFTDEGVRTVKAPVITDPMKVTATDAEKAAVIVETMLAGRVTVTFDDKKWTFEPADVGEWIDFRTVESSASSAVTLEPFVSSQKASAPVTKALGTKVGRSAKSAQFKAADGRVKIIPSQNGIGPDVENLALTLTGELKDSAADRVVELRTSSTEPEITTEKARSMGVKERISSYTTTYGSGNRPRVNNIHVLGDALNGTLIEPGGVFSFNGTAGERTASKGYQEAGAIVNGKIVPQLGGGVCQVGTTIFNTVFESGLPVIERRNHSFYISHYPTGRDATVSWGGPDFKFKNDTENWVLIAVSYTNSSITISLYGTNPGYEVKEEKGSWSAVRPFPIEKIKDPQMLVGTTKVEDGGVSGRSITVKRIVSKGGKVLRTDSFTSNYKPKVQVVRVGTKPDLSVKPPPATP